MRQFPSPFILLLLLSAVLADCGSVSAQTSQGKLIFADSAGRLLLINSDGSGQTFLTSDASKLDANPEFSPDGSKIAFDRAVLGKTNIYVMNADGSNPVAITLETTSSNVHPTWSPDGTKLAFLSNRGGQRKEEIFVVNADGTGLVQLTTNVQVSTDGQGPVYGLDFDPRWSPDGSRIAFSSSRDGNAEIYVMNADGSNQTRLTNNPIDDRYPTWSPDSQRIAFSRNGGSGSGINIMNRDGTNATNISPNGFMPAWSPDATKFALARLDPGNGFRAAIFVMNVDGTNSVKISNTSQDCFGPAWAPGSSVPSSAISGHVLDSSGTPISAATLTMTGNITRTAQSDATGAYSFSGLGAGDYRIDVAKSGLGFNPSFVIITNLTANQVVNFTGFVGFSISGQVSGLNGDGIVVSLSGSQTRSAQTDLGGHYSFDLVPAGGNYVVAINSQIWNISPSSFTFNNLSANQVANFSAVVALYAVTGRITRLGNPLLGVTVSLANNNTGFTPPTTTTDANGQYAFANIRAGGSYSVRPTAALYLFDPQTRDFNPLNANQTADFVAFSVNHVLFNNSSLTVNEGQGSLQLNVVRGGNSQGVGTITVDYATADGTAKAGSDYTAVSGTLTFPEGTFSRTITIPILDDQLAEGSEQFSISLSNATGNVDLGTPSTVTITITDNEPTAAPILATETNSDRAVALNESTFAPGPFSLITNLNFSSDTRTRLSFFAENVPFTSPQGITVDAEDAQHNHIQLPLEGVFKLSGNNPFTQLIVRLPENLSSGDLLITVTSNGLSSNKARISIQP